MFSIYLAFHHILTQNNYAYASRVSSTLLLAVNFALCNLFSVVDCGTLPSVDNSDEAIYHNSSATTYGATASYQCLAGYELYVPGFDPGYQSTFVCNETNDVAVWVGDIPQCRCMYSNLNSVLL